MLRWAFLFYLESIKICYVGLQEAKILWHRFPKSFFGRCPVANKSDDYVLSIARKGADEFELYKKKSDTVSLDRVKTYSQTSRGSCHDVGRHLDAGY